MYLGLLASGAVRGQGRWGTTGTRRRCRAASRGTAPSTVRSRTRGRPGCQLPCWSGCRLSCAPRRQQPETRPGLRRLTQLPRRTQEPRRRLLPGPGSALGRCPGLRARGLRPGRLKRLRDQARRLAVGWQAETAARRPTRLPRQANKRMPGMLGRIPSRYRLWSSRLRALLRRRRQVARNRSRLPVRQVSRPRRSRPPRAGRPAGRAMRPLQDRALASVRAPRGGTRCPWQRRAGRPPRERR